MRIRSLVVGMALAPVLLGGCASLVAPEYSADYAAVDAMKRAGLPKAAVAPVQPQDPAAPVNRITLRGSGLVASSGTFAAYLEKALTSDLSAAGVLDQASKRRIAVRLLRNDIDVSGFGEGRGDIAIELSVTDQGVALLTKNYEATTRFESSFVGAVAIPKGQSEYPNLVRALLAKVYRDPEFMAAMKRS